ncbi:MAG: hypothetical protein AAFV90_27395 [Cyanobacteria bacterium J06634_5]
MPKPCRKPLKSNPYETYRDPITGQWKVKYPASALPVLSESSELSKVEQGKSKTPKRRLWKKSSRSKVA